MKWLFSRKQGDAVRVNLAFDAAERRYAMTVTDGCVEHRFTVGLCVCDNPCCGCQSIELICIPDHKITSAQETKNRVIMSLDVRERRVTQSRAGTRDCDPAFAKAVADGMDDDGWITLVSHLYGAKRDQMRSMDLDSLDVQFPPQIMDDDGAMVGYSEIFPFAEWFQFAVDDGKWVVGDQYCVNPRCKCRDVALTLFPAETADKPSKAGDVLTIRYDYHGGSFEVLREPTIPASPCSELVAALRKAYPDLAATFRERHRQLRHLFMRVKRKHGAKLPMVSDSAEKVGRNDPCPCGSGKKYKRCCGG